MKTSYLGVLAAAMIVGSPALADMVAASPGVTLTQAAQAKFNHNASGDEQIGTPATSGSSGIPAPLYSAAGVSPDDGWSLQHVAAAKFVNDGNSQGGMLRRASETGVSLAYGEERDYSKLAMAAGLSPEEAAGMSFQEIATAKLNNEH